MYKTSPGGGALPSPAKIEGFLPKNAHSSHRSPHLTKNRRAACFAPPIPDTKSAKSNRL
jgi:hypothetical protein